MISKRSNQARKNIQMIDIESMVPKDHLVRMIDEVIDFEFIRDIVKEYYLEDKGRPSIDPVVLFKIVFIQFLFGIRSMRQTIKEINVNVAYRWFLGFVDYSFHNLSKNLSLSNIFLLYLILS